MSEPAGGNVANESEQSGRSAEAAVRHDRRLALVAGLAAVTAAACQPLRPAIGAPRRGSGSTSPTTVRPTTTTTVRPTTTTSTTTTTVRPTTTTTSTTTTTVSPTTTTVPVPPAVAVPADPRHVARRLTFGATPALVAEVEQLGSAKWIDRQLALAPGVDAALDAQLAFMYPYSRRSAADIALSAEPWRIAYELPAATVVRSVCAQRQVFERVVGFFWDHFSVDVTNDRCQFQCADYDEQVIRANAFGRFETLLLGVAKSGAMLQYLDQATSQARGGRIPNENFARELMELHTVGSDAGYSEADVTAVAYLLSGWALPHPHASFTFMPGLHWLGPFVDARRSVLGWTRGALTGLAAGESFIRHLAHHPATARRLAHGLAVRFIGEHVTQSDLVVRQAAAAYLDNDTAIVPMLRVLLTSQAFADSSRRRVRRPSELLAAMLRATSGTTWRIADPTEAERSKWQIAGLLTPLANRPHSWPDPNGYPDADESWVGVGALIARWNMGTAMAVGAVPGFPVEPLELVSWSAGPTLGDWLTAAANRCDVALDPASRTRYLSNVGRRSSDPLPGISEPWVYHRLLAMLLQTPDVQVH